MVKELKKIARISVRITKELDESLSNLIEKKKTETGVQLTKTQVLELVIQEGLKHIK